jgi:DNA-binding XRE family transcriptional regulator
MLARNNFYGKVRRMAKHLKSWRKARQLTQTQAADLLGVTQVTWSKWEAGIIPAEQCPRVHSLTGIDFHLLRPDVYPVGYGKNKKWQMT